jgi:hypothetical protein
VFTTDVRHDSAGLVVAGAEAPARGCWHSRGESAKPIIALSNLGLRVLTLKIIRPGGDRQRGVSNVIP